MEEFVICFGMNHLKESILKIYMLSYYTFDHVLGVRVSISTGNEITTHILVIQVLLLTLV
jgi:hypothetical protein